MVLSSLKLGVICTIWMFKLSVKWTNRISDRPTPSNSEEIQNIWSLLRPRLRCCSKWIRCRCFFPAICYSDVIMVESKIFCTSIIFVVQSFCLEKRPFQRLWKNLNFSMAASSSARSFWAVRSSMLEPLAAEPKALQESMVMNKLLPSNENCKKRKEKTKILWSGV